MLRDSLIFAGCLILASGCSPSVPDEVATEAVVADAPVAEPTERLPSLEAPLEVGSQEARNDLFCSGLLFAANPEPLDALSPVDEAIRMKAVNLGMSLGFAGINKLIDEGVADFFQGSQVADAWAIVAASELDSGSPRISLDTCRERANALPPPE